MCFFQFRSQAVNSARINYITSHKTMGPQGVLGIWGEWLFIFRKLWSTGNYFRGAREQAHNFGDLGSLAKKQKNKQGKPSIFIRLLHCPTYETRAYEVSAAVYHFV